MTDPKPPDIVMGGGPDADSSGAAGAPETEVTPGMVKAGDEIFRQFAIEVWESSTSEALSEFLTELYMEMSRVKRRGAAFVPTSKATDDRLMKNARCDISDLRYSRTPIVYWRWVDRPTGTIRSVYDDGSIEISFLKDSTTD